MSPSAFYSTLQNAFGPSIGPPGECYTAITACCKLQYHLATVQKQEKHETAASKPAALVGVTNWLRQSVGSKSPVTSLRTFLYLQGRMSTMAKSWGSDNLLVSSVHCSALSTVTGCCGFRMLIARGAACTVPA